MGLFCIAKERVQFCSKVVSNADAVDFVQDVTDPYHIFLSIQAYELQAWIKVKIGVN